jgi:hypothetical protein
MERQKREPHPHAIAFRRIKSIEKLVKRLVKRLRWRIDPRSVNA